MWRSGFKSTKRCDIYNIGLCMCIIFQKANHTIMGPSALPWIDFDTLSSFVIATPFHADTYDTHMYCK